MAPPGVRTSEVTLSPAGDAGAAAAPARGKFPLPRSPPPSGALRDAGVPSSPCPAAHRAGAASCLFPTLSPSASQSSQAPPSFPVARRLAEGRERGCAPRRWDPRESPGVQTLLRLLFPAGLPALAHWVHFQHPAHHPATRQVGSTGPGGSHITSPLSLPLSLLP